MKDSKARELEFGFAANLTGTGAFASEAALLRLAANGRRIGGVSALTIGTMRAGATVTNAGAFANEGAELARNWSSMPSEQRVTAMLQMGFWGMTSAVGARQARSVGELYNPIKAARTVMETHRPGSLPDVDAGLRGLSPEAARAYIRDLRANLAPERQRELLAKTIAAEPSAARTAALSEFGEEYANLPDLNAFKRPDGTAVAETPTERLALANILAQKPHMTPQELLRVQEWAMLGDAVFAANPGSPDRIPANYERVTDFSKDPLLKGFSRANFENKDTGFYAELYRNKDTGEYVLAIRGTRFTSWADWMSNGRQNFGLEDEQYQQAMTLGKDLKRALQDKFAGVTGQSKGGGQAAAAAMVAGKPAITFNAAGLNPRTVENAGGTYDGRNIENWRIGDKTRGYEALTHLQEEHPVTRHFAWPAAGEKQYDLLPIDSEGNLIEDTKPFNMGFQDHRPFSVLNSTLAVRGAKPRRLFGAPKREP